MKHLGFLILYWFKETYYNYKNYIKNRIRFNSVLWNYRDYDSEYCIRLFTWSLRNLQNALVHDVDCLKKREKIEELCKLIEEKPYEDVPFKAKDETIEEYNEKWWKIYSDHLDKIFAIIKGDKNDNISGILNWWD